MRWRKSIDDVSSRTGHFHGRTNFARSGLVDGFPSASPREPQTSLALPCVRQGEQSRTLSLLAMGLVVDAKISNILPSTRFVRAL